MQTTSFSREEHLFIILFATIILLELIFGDLENYSQIHYIAKPAIVVSLIFALLKFSKPPKIILRNLVLGGLVLSVIGDILLMMVDDWSHAFTFGLIAFLLAHVLYCCAFWKQREKSKSPITPLVPLLIYAGAIFFILKTNLGEMLIPVIAYMLVIIIMATLSFLRRKSQQILSFWFVFGGALFFLISDSLLAINKFATPLPFAHISIMLTYALAQFGIVFGILKSKV